MDEKDIKVIFDRAFLGMANSFVALQEHLSSIPPQDLATFISCVEVTNQRGASFKNDPEVIKAKMALCTSLCKLVTLHDEIGAATQRYVKADAEWRARHN